MDDPMAGAIANEISTLAPAVGGQNNSICRVSDGGIVFLNWLTHHFGCNRVLLNWLTPHFGCNRNGVEHTHANAHIFRRSP